MTEPSKPWYSHPLVWMMISIPFSAVIMGVVMIWLAVDTNDGLVADDYYKQGLAINDVISLDKRAAELKLNAEIQFSSTGNVINMRFDKGMLDVMPDRLRLHFQHATHADSDVVVTMAHGMGDGYIGRLPGTISQGIWYFELADMDRDWKLNARAHVLAANTIKLESGI